jgi:hypothetical protein
MASVVRSAASAACLSTEINGLAAGCPRDSDTDALAAVSGQLTMLSAALTRLHGGMSTGDAAYTAAFHQDLAEIIEVLNLVLGEVRECADELQKLNPPSINAAKWFFTKGRANRLHKHLTSLNTTIVVMRTVLDHAKDYGNYQ